MKNYDCALIADLLPSYAESLTSDETNTFITQHLAACEPCQTLLEDYTANINMPAPLSSSPKEKKHVKRLQFQLLWYLFWPLVYGAMIQFVHPETLRFFISMLAIFGFVFISSHNMEYNFDLDDSKKEFYEKENRSIRAGKGTFLVRGIIWLLPILLPVLLMLIQMVIEYLR